MKLVKVWGDVAPVVGSTWMSAWPEQGASMQIAENAMRTMPSA